MLFVSVMLFTRPEINGCRHKEFMNITHPDTQLIYQSVMANCRTLHCLEECKDVKKNLQSHPCMTGYIHDYIRYQALAQAQKDLPKFLMMLAALNSCDMELAHGECNNTIQGKSSTETNIVSSICIFFTCITFAFVFYI